MSVSVNKINKVSNKDNLSFRKQFKNEKSYIDYVKSKFPHKNGVKYGKVMVTKIGDYSVTRPEFADMMSEIIINRLHKRKSCGKKCVITDATAGMGGNTLSFAKYFDRVNSVEYDPNHCKYLKNNVDVYGYGDKVNVICDSYLNVMNDIKQNVIFFDPPWGGVDYRKVKKMNLFLGKINVIDIVKEMINKVDMIAMKVPSNFNLGGLMADKSLRGEVMKIRNYKLIIITSV